jgi:GH24 family phage-related lysozyme (muramidase)
MKKLFFISFLLIINTSFNIPIDKKLKLKKIKNVDFNFKIRPPLNYLDSLIKFIKKHEGKRLNPYYCVGGFKTVGYGHILKKRDKNLKFPLTDYQADSLLIADIMGAKKYVIANTPKIKDPKKFWFAVHFTFCKGIGNFNKSTIKKKLINNYSLKCISNDLKTWCYYNNKGERIRSQWSYKIRLGEINFLKTGSFGNMTLN